MRDLRCHRGGVRALPPREEGGGTLVDLMVVDTPVVTIQEGLCKGEVALQHRLHEEPQGRGGRVHQHLRLLLPVGNRAPNSWLHNGWEVAGYGWGGLAERGLVVAPRWSPPSRQPVASPPPPYIPRARRRAAGPGLLHT